MTALADKLRVTAQRLVNKFGVVVTYNLDDATYDADEQDVSPTAATTRRTVKISPPEDYVDEYVNSDGILGERETFRSTLPYLGELINGSFRALSFVPAKGHSIEWGGIAHEILRKKTLGGDANPIAYELLLAKGGG